MRVGDIILKKETIDLMNTNQLTDSQRVNYWVTNYGYGLGVRCPMDNTVTDFGWGGAAGSFLFVDRENGITAFYAQHVLSSPVHQIRGEIRPIIQEILK